VVTSTIAQDLIEVDIFTRIVNAIRETGYFVADNIFTPEQLASLLVDLSSVGDKQFQSAGIGREQQVHTDNNVRRDSIYWLERRRSAIDFYWTWMEQLRMRINSEIFLGLFEYECHYAQYEKGAFYSKHLDAFQGSSNRKLSTVLYLNPAWHSDDGGELVLYSEDGENVIFSLLPSMGTLVVFLSEMFPHEVRKTHRTRYSLTGWFRVNNTTSLNLDPPR